MSCTNKDFIFLFLPLQSHWNLEVQQTVSLNSHYSQERAAGTCGHSSAEKKQNNLVVVVYHSQTLLKKWEFKEQSNGYCCVSLAAKGKGKTMISTL